MSTLFLIQNDTHLKNFCGDITEADFFIDIGRLTGQSLRLNKVECGNEISIKSHNVNFYNMNNLQRILFLIKFKINNNKKLDSLNIDRVVIGNDGAIQKLIIESLSNNEIKVDMWLDGIIDLNSNYYLNIIKLIMNKLTEKLFFTYLSPSVIGTYGRITNLFVMDESVKLEYLTFSKFVDNEKITVTPFPRHALLLTLAKKIKKTVFANQKLRILYLTSAWRFHNHIKEHEFQINHVKSLLKAFKSHHRYELFIRIHPRENNESFGFIPENCLSNYLSYEEDLCSANFVLSARSTGLFEADKVGIPVLIFNEFFGDTFLNDYLKTLERVDSTYTLIEALDNKLYA